MNKERKIKGLQTQLNNLQGDVEAIKLDLTNKQDEYNFKKKKIKEIQHEINKYRHNGQIKISEHAIIRYLERVKGIDIAKIEKEIVTDEVRRMVGVLGGNGSYPNKEFKLVMKNYTIVTIV